MKKRILIFLSVLAVVLTLIALMVMTASAEDNPKTITISYMQLYQVWLCHLMAHRLPYS